MKLLLDTHVVLAIVNIWDRALAAHPLACQAQPQP